MTRLEDVLDQLYYSATSEREKGDKFERLMLAFFKTDVQWADRFADVWMWSEWPERHGRRDNGIDLVAVDRATNETVAIQCKFYDPAHYLTKPDIDSFLSESGKAPFAQRLVVSTTDRWNVNAEAAIENQQIPVQRLRFMDLAESSIDWSQFDLTTPEVMELKDKKQLRKHQTTALEKVRAGLATADRGKLIMACGTGKTFTSLRIAEDLVKPGGTVLFLVPSISLLSQTLREWSIEADTTLRPFAVCSDVKVGRRAADATEDISVVDLAIPATTNPSRLHAQLAKPAPDQLTVVFSTYQSIAVVAEAQTNGLADFDLVICDEAHRTTGTTLAGTDESAFVKVHDNTFIRATKRLYMTATPRIYDDSSKAKAGQAQAVLASMDDESLYGAELHRLGFGEAVTKGLLTDYKVLVLAVDEKDVSRTFQDQLADENSELRLDDAAKIVGCWNGLAKRGHAESGFGEDTAPMTRAVAFAGSIAKSKQFAAMFSQVTADYVEARRLAGATTGDDPLQCEVDHVDGTFNVLERNKRLDWLKAEVPDGACRVLTNARCLSEGVDVPALDAVMFLNPRKSVVDVVQSVGRVMRKAPGKQYGYIILPIGIPAGMKPEDALKDNTKYAVVWEVLQALRAHDERFNAMVNKIELNKTRNDKIQIIGVGGGADTDRDGSSAPSAGTQGTFNFEWLQEWAEAIYAKIVTKVGDRRYWETWAQDIAVIAERHTTRITALLETPGSPAAGEFDTFLAGLRGNLNDSITAAQAVDMLAQHLITRPVFDALFEGYSFAEHNPVSQVMQRMLDLLDEQNLGAESETLDKFYESVRLRAEGIDNAAGKQRIISELYEKFFRIAFPRTAESLGIVYTPVEVVDFILSSVEHLLGTEFGASLSDEGVHVLDPFTGTGTFMVRLLESGLINPHDLARKYASELHANEILLLAYYIAAINIEATYHAVRAEADPDAGYEPFGGIVLADTFQMTEHGDVLDTAVFPVNNARASEQLALDIRVIVGNPPYSVGQTSANDNNANLKYPTLDKHIETTYAARSSATNKNSLYDSYIRAIRWASDRVKDAGIIGFVTNGGFLDANTADGLRKTLADEFATIYVYNLRGNQRTAGELSRREGGKIFGAGSRNTVAITFLVKKPGHTGLATIHYRDIGDYLTREDKLDIVAHDDLALIDWQPIEPNAAGDWINQRGDVFDTFTPIGSKSETGAIFRVHSGGLKTNRDAWVYNSSSSTLQASVGGLVAFHNGEVDRVASIAKAAGRSARDLNADDVLTFDPTRTSWNRADKSAVLRGVKRTVPTDRTFVAAYRPFNKQHVAFDRTLNDMVYGLYDILPTPQHRNLGIELTGVSSHFEFTPFITDALPDLHLLDTGQFFPRWTYEAVGGGDSGQGALDLNEATADVVSGYRRLDNVTDSALTEYRVSYEDDVTKDDIFFYVYGLLHSPDYRATFAADLKKSLPRIPKVAGRADFDAFVAAGRSLADLHVGYERVEPYPLTIVGEPAMPPSVYGAEHALYRVEKMRWGGTAKSRDRSTIVYNSRITVSGIPDEAHEYMLGSRSGIEWVMERYQVKTDKASGIVNDPNDWSGEVGNPRYILDLLCRVVTVSVETVRIVKSLPSIDFTRAS
ncbi:DEAD/DEAH box helicase [Cellulomonas fulva]|uniref:DEAD/DEAH box helicase n=1 Tax=Cellulomonas fulva TaxID=2835530 RepID=UPI0027DE43A4|nr:DEAD/DEAH box helicase [Cellulomonas fulva]